MFFLEYTILKQGAYNKNTNKVSVWEQIGAQFVVRDLPLSRLEDGVLRWDCLWGCSVKKCGKNG